MNLDLNGKNAIVTGGGRGLCRSIAQGLHDAGARVILVGSTGAAKEAAAEMGSQGAQVYAVTGDLSDKESLGKIFRECMEIFQGRVHILVNGAGTQYRSQAEEFPQEQWERIIQVNLNAVFYLCQMAGKVMLEQGYGKIINIASMTSFFGSVRIPAYTASKGAIAQLTKALSNEWAGRGICVNAIAPGYMETKLTAEIKTQDPRQYAEITGRIPAGRWGNGEDLKGLAVFLASDAASYITGAVIPVDGGYLGK